MDYPVYQRLRHPKSFGKICLRERALHMTFGKFCFAFYGVLSNKFNVMLSEFPGMMRFAFAPPRMSRSVGVQPGVPSVLDVLFSGAVLKIGHMVIKFVAILMVYIHAIRLWANKGPRDKSMNGNGVFSARHCLVSVDKKAVAIGHGPLQQSIVRLRKDISAFVNKPKMFKVWDGFLHDCDLLFANYIKVND